MPTTTQKKPKRVREHLSFGASIWAFGVELVFNLLLVITVFSFGLSSGFAGRPTFDWGQVGATIGALFGGTWSLLAFIGAIAIFGGTLWFVHMLSKKGHHFGVVVAFALGVTVGGFLVWKVVNWGEFGLGFAPILAILGFTALETLITAYVVPTTPRPKGNTNS